MLWIIRADERVFPVSCLKTYRISFSTRQEVPDGPFRFK